MFQQGYFAHVDPDGTTPFERMRTGGVSFRAAGENLALAPTVEVAHNGLMNSPGHRENILSPDFTQVGTGIGYDAPERSTASRVGVYVQNFGG
jgi:uncharacterized protein YkwD